jgi:endonuclease YncB( thermonuclease family)
VAVCALVAVPNADAADEIGGTVTGVPSGDTLQVAKGARRIEVRLADIGAPHGNDFYAPPARALLDALVSGKSVRVVITGRSGPDRVFGRAFLGSLNVNLELIRRGAAWLCIEYATDTDYLPFQREAQRQQLGLWASANTNDFDARIRCRQRPPAERPVGKS